MASYRRETFIIGICIKFLKSYQIFAHYMWKVHTISQALLKQTVKLFDTNCTSKSFLYKRNFIHGLFLYIYFLHYISHFETNLSIFKLLIEVNII